MKIVYCGDLHGMDAWKKIIAANPDMDKLVFLGDYFDSYTVPGIVQIHNFKEICEYARENNSIMLVGNHDLYAIGSKGWGGYQVNIAFSIALILRDNLDILKVAYLENNVLCIHAGVSYTFLVNAGYDFKQPVDEFLNELWKYKPNSFNFISGGDIYGNNGYQSPLWIRPKALMEDNKKNGFDKYIQIVGHTQIENIEAKEDYYFVDTMHNSQEYLTQEDGVFKINQL